MAFLAKKNAFKFDQGGEQYQKIAGLADVLVSRSFGWLSSACSASLQIEGGSVTTMENATATPIGSVSTGGPPATCQQHGWQWSRPLVSGPGQNPLCRASNAYFRSLGLPTLIDGC
jgi:hypothetical protein